MKANKIEFSKDGLIIDNKKYGLGITKVEIEDIRNIKIYIRIMKNFEENKKLYPEWEDINNPLELRKYENIKLIEE